jgi:hypothetical protein
MAFEIRPQKLANPIGLIVRCIEFAMNNSVNATTGSHPCGIDLLYDTSIRLFSALETPTTVSEAAEFIRSVTKPRQ